MLRTPKNLGVNTFADPVSHFGAPKQPFWILQAVRRCRRCASAPFAARLVFVVEVEAKLGNIAALVVVFACGGVVMVVVDTRNLRLKFG